MKNNIWSDKKIIDKIINILLFLVGVNFLHYGQFILPLICLILFIDNRFKLRIKNIKLFIILCLFGITFFAFSYKTGFYSVMGLCLPMAYCIGSNMKNVTEDNVKKIIYILCFGMCTHLVLNFIYDFTIVGTMVLKKYSHYDIWTGTKVETTGTAVNYVLINAAIYYLCLYEKNIKIKYTGIASFVIILIYELGLGKRAPILLLVIAIVISLVLDFIVLRNRKISENKIKLLLFFLICLVVFIAIVLITNVFGIRDKLGSLHLVLKFKDGIIDLERIKIFSQATKLIPVYLWGNQTISGIIGINIHDLWFDTYDYAGIIPFILLVVATIYYLKAMIRVLKNNNIANSNKVLFLCVCCCSLIWALIEPVMTGSSLFLMISIIIISSIGNLN